MTKDELASLLAEAESKKIEELRKSLNRALLKIEELKDHEGRLRQALEEAVHDLIPLVTVQPAKPPAKDRRRKDEEVAVVMLSDVQLGKVTPDYNTEVAIERVRRYAQKVIKLTEIQRHDHPVKRCHIWLLGDLVEGELIFPGQEHRIDASLFRQAIVDGPSMLGEFVLTLAEHFEHVHVEGVIGNHGAIGGRSRRNMHPESNADMFLMEVTRQVIEASGTPNVTWDLPQPAGERAWFHVSHIGNYSCLLFHGDQIRGGFGGFPWYGFGKKVQGWAMLGYHDAFPIDQFDDAACGHWHTPTSFYLNGARVRVNGTTESYNTYAMENLGKMGEPTQWLMFVDPERGRVTAEYLVDLSD